MKIYRLLVKHDDREFFVKANTREDVIYNCVLNAMDTIQIDYISAKALIKSCRVYHGKVDPAMVHTINW